MPIIYPICHHSKGLYKCFAVKDGRCKILRDTAFEGYECPFYKERKAQNIKPIKEDNKNGE